MKRKKLLNLIMTLILFISVTTISFSKDAKDIKVKKPVKLSVLDVAGNLKMSKASIEAFKNKYPNLVSSVEYIIATAPEVAAKVKAQQMANNIDTTLVVTGYYGMATGMKDKVWEQIMPKYKEFFPTLEKDYLPAAKKNYDFFNGYGIAHVFSPGGPVFIYNPDKVKNVPKTAADLLAWCKANPGKFSYARPLNSGPGFELLQGLPYILGDKDPKNPKTWDKTWAYFRELDNCIDYYPPNTAITFKEFGEGTRWIIASQLGWDMNQRILATIPATTGAFILDNTTFVTDTQFMVMPAGLDNDRKNVTLALMAWLMTPEQQAMTYDSAYLYPGPSIKGVTLSMAPKESQDQVKSAQRDVYEKAIKELPETTFLEIKALIDAMDTWDKLVGSKVKK